MDDIIPQLRENYGKGIDSFFHISLKHRYLFVQTPKVASTTLKRALVKLEIRGTKLKLKDIGLHPTLLTSVHVKPFQLPGQMFRGVLTGDQFKRFCFVRNPYARILSAYMDKVAGLDKRGLGAGFRRQYGLDEYASVSFKEFLDLLRFGDIGETDWDQHWRPQFILLRPDLIKYDLIGKLETFDDSYAELKTLLKDKIDDYRTIAPHKTNAADLLDEHYTPELRAIVADLYAKDFEHFDYPV